MKEKRPFSMSAVGAGSLLAAFAVLTLTVFALLSLATAQAEQRLAESSYRAITEYYAADLQAEEVFARLRQGQQPADVQQEGNRYRYSCPISESQTLFVELEHTQEGWQVQRWQAVAAQQEEKTGQNVWEGNREESP